MSIRTHKETNISLLSFQPLLTGKPTLTQMTGDLFSRTGQVRQTSDGRKKGPMEMVPEDLNLPGQKEKNQEAAEKESTFTLNEWEKTI